jgi:hypothetical protein
MMKARFILILTALMTVVFAASAQSITLTITPPSGPHGTNHVAVGTGLTPQQSYRLDVVFQDTGETVFSADLTADDNGQVRIELLTEPSDAPGVYDIILYDSADQIAAATITITSQIQPPATDASIAYNQTVEGAFDQNIAREDYTFDGAQGDIVTITMRSTEFDTFLTLYGPDGTQLRFNDNALPPTDSALYSYELPESGRYTIAATSREAAESGGSNRGVGAYSLTLTVARAAQEGEIAAGETIVGELSLVAQRAQYTFEGRGGDVVTIDLRSEAFDSVVLLFTADGTQIAQDDDGGGGLNARITRFRLPADGEYVVIVDGFRGFTGERRLQGKFTVSLEIEGQGPVVAQATPSQSTPDASTPVAQATPVPATPTPLPVLTGAGGTVDYGETIAGELTESEQTGSFTFTGTAGDVVTIALDSAEFDPKVTLIGPDGQPLTEDDDSGPDLNALIREFTLPADGEYTIVVDGFRGAAGDRTLVGQFALTLNAAGVSAQQPQPTVDPAQPTAAAATQAPVASSGGIASGQPVSGEFNESTQNAAYTFDGRSGDTVTIDLRSDEIDPLVRLIGPDGQILAEDDDSGGGVQARIAEFALPADGTYTIEVDAFRGIDSTRVVLGAFELTLNLTAAPVVEAQPTTPPEATSAPATATPDAATPQAASPTASAPAATVAPPPAGEVGSIAPGETAQITFGGAAGEAYSFRFTGSAGDVVGFTVTSDGLIDTKLEIVAEDGIAVSEDDDSGSGFDPELLGITLPAYGGYIVTVRPVVEGATGTATLTYASYTETALGEGGVSITLNDKYGPQVLRFNGRGGETVRLIVVSTSQIGGAPEIVVTQDGETLASQVLGRNLRLTFEFVTPADGRVDVKVLRDAGAYGELEISIERLVEEESPEE